MASAGTKRARTAGSGGGGDWTCPKCGNVNFAFRTTCNMRNCNCPKPGDSQRGAGGPSYLQPVYDQSVAARYLGGPGAPPTLPLTMQPGYGTGYGAGYGVGYGSAGYGASLPLAGAPAGLPYNYDFSLSVNPSAAYNPLTLPPAYGPPAAVIGGTGYNPGSVVDGYGVGLNMGRMPPMGTALYPEENGARKRRGGSGSEGDWVCPKCKNLNYAFRETCNMKNCGQAKPTQSVSGATPEGSWKCDKCGNINYPFRTKCNRKSCNADRPSTEKSS